MILIAIGVTGYFVEGLRIILAQTPLPGLSPVGYACALGFTTAGVTPASAVQVHQALWWVHAFLALGFIALMPFSRLLHSIAGTINLATRDHALGLMTPISIEEVEATGQIGVAKLIRLQLSPADRARCLRLLRPLRRCLPRVRSRQATLAAKCSPRPGRRHEPRGHRSNVHGQPIAAETLWSCTTCAACAAVCPLGISPMRMITDMRRYLIGEGALRGSPAAALQKTDRVGNPWGMAPTDRLAWAAGLNVPVASEHGQFEILYWVGCAAAYDRRVQKVARSVVRLLQAANVNFAISRNRRTLHRRIGPPYRRRTPLPATGRTKRFNTFEA